jgi:uncharacterized cupredoxin-like copper-binding protein
VSQARRSAVAVLLMAVAAIAGGCAPAAMTVTITIHYSAFDRTEIHVPRGVPVTFVLVNEDPIDHEWLIGDAAFHERHRIGTHAAHGAVPNEVTVPALETKHTTLTFEEAGQIEYICHLPGHEAYGMVGVVVVGNG